MKKRMIAFIVALCCIITLLPSDVFAKKSSRETADLLISSAQDLREFANRVNKGESFKGKVVQLTQDIVFDGVSLNNFKTIGIDRKKHSELTWWARSELENYSTWIPYTMKFEGIFDGAFHSITGIDQTDGFCGLFACIGENGVVKNVTIKNSKFTNVYGAGIAIFNLGKIENCHTEGTLNFWSDGAGIAYLNKGLIENSSNKMDITSRMEWSIKMAGIVEYNQGIIRNCYNTGDITGKTGDLYQSAGIASINEGGNVENCYNTGNLISFLKREEDSTYWTISYSGGIVGKNIEANNSGIIQNCYNMGSIFSTVYGDVSTWERNSDSESDGTVGSIVGYSEDGMVRKCYGAGSIPIIGKHTGTSDYDNESISAADLQSGYLFAMLNRNRGENNSWSKWILEGNSVYPTFAPTHEITFLNTINGYVTSNYSAAYKEQKVTLKAIPNKNCKLSFLTVVTKTGKTVNTKLVKNGYEFDMPDEEVVIGASFELNYVVSLKASKNGKIKVNKKAAFEGDKVTLTATPNKKHKLKAISVKTITGKKVAVKKVNGKYQFTMPKSNVIISASFK